MKEILVTQGTDEWFECRQGKATGSHFDLLMPTDGQKKKIATAIDKGKPLPPKFSDGQLTYLYKVTSEILTNMREESFESKSMRWGTEQEVFAKKAYSLKHFVKVRDCGFYTDEKLTGSSPDGIIGDNDRTFETKCPESKMHFYYSLFPVELYNKYKWQCIGECYFTGIKKGVICSFDPRYEESKQLVEYEFEPTLQEYAELENRLVEVKNQIMEWIGEKPIQVDF